MYVRANHLNAKITKNNEEGLTLPPKTDSTREIITKHLLSKNNEDQKNSNGSLRADNLSSSPRSR